MIIPREGYRLTSERVYHIPASRDYAYRICRTEMGLALVEFLAKPGRRIYTIEFEESERLDNTWGPGHDEVTRIRMVAVLNPVEHHVVKMVDYKAMSTWELSASAFVEARYRIKSFFRILFKR